MFDTQTLELNKVKEQLSSLAFTEHGAERALKLEPSVQRETVEERLRETAEAYRYIHHDAVPSFDGVKVIDDALERARIEGVLDVPQFLRVRSHIDASIQLKREMHRLPEDLGETFGILEHAEAIDPPAHLRESLGKVFNDHGDVRDEASPALRDIRRRLADQERRIKSTLDAFLKKHGEKLSEQLVTIRQDRYVVPVRASNKKSLKGTILDYSSSGETVYIEPENVQGLAAEKRRLEKQEAEELERLFRWLSGLIMETADTLQANDEAIAHLDFLFAKARYGHETEGSIPRLSERIHLIRARHPLLPPDEVVANTFAFDDETTMIITGSNTGGKTVALKTVGLLHLMAQSGLMVPAVEGSTIRLFSAIRADIGDEQSIEQSLSTFSSHLSRIVDIVDRYDDDQLVLLDELGSGTDPREGSSLAMSILNYLGKKNSIIVATTHYPELKAYAYTRSDVMNASVEFDETTLEPTYRLLLRTPGESHAFLISERLGLKREIVDAAKEEVLTQRSEVSDLIDTLKREHKKLDKELSAYEDARKEVEREQKRLAEERKRLQQERNNLEEKLRKEHEQQMREAKRRAQQLISELEAMRDRPYKPHELADKKHDAKHLMGSDTTQSETSGTDDSQLQAGDSVYVFRFNRYGRLEKQQKDGRWQVRMGNLTSTFKPEELERSAEQDAAEEPQTAYVNNRVDKQVDPSLDLRGKRVAEARELLEKYLDDCALSQQPYATIIHGFGTLALKKMVRDVVGKHPHVKRHRDGEGNEGGQGVTIAYFE